MTKAKIALFVHKELADLDVMPQSDAYIAVYENAVEAYECIGRKETKKLIEEHLSQFNFAQRGL